MSLPLLISKQIKDIAEICQNQARAYATNHIGDLVKALNEG